MNEFNESSNLPEPQPQFVPVVQPQNGSRGLAIASMVLGIVSMGLCWCWVLTWTMFISIACAITGLILGIISLKKRQGGKGMAITGVILSGAGIILGIIIIVFYAILFTAMLSQMPDIMRDFNRYDNFYMG